MKGDSAWLTRSRDVKQSGSSLKLRWGLSEKERKLAVFYFYSVGQGSAKQMEMTFSDVCLLSEMFSQMTREDTNVQVNLWQADPWIMMHLHLDTIAVRFQKCIHSYGYLSPDLVCAASAASQLFGVSTAVTLHLHKWRLRFAAHSNVPVFIWRQLWKGSSCWHYDYYCFYNLI